MPKLTIHGPRQRAYSHPGHSHDSCSGSWTLDPLTHGRLATGHFPSPKEAGSIPNLESALSRLPPHDLAFFSSEDPLEFLFLLPFLFASLSLLTRVWAYRQGWVCWGLTWAQSLEQHLAEGNRSDAGSAGAHTLTGRKNLLSIYGTFLPPLLGWLAHGQSIRKGSPDRTNDGGTISALGGAHSPVSPDPSQPFMTRRRLSQMLSLPNCSLCLAAGTSLLLPHQQC